MKYWRTADLNNTPNYLMHHGIQGQKWGVSHGPPYPLGNDVSTGNKLKTKVVSNLPHKRVSANRMRNYTKSEQARISEGQAMGAMLGGLPGMMVGSYLTKRHINRENAGLRDKKYTNDERVRINNAYETTGLIGTALSRHNVKKENKQAAQKEALSVIDNMNGFNKEDFEVSKTKRTKDGNNYIIEVSHKEDPEMSMFVKVTKDKNSGKMSVSNIGLTEEDAKSGSKGSNAEKIKVKSDSYDTKPATKDSTQSSSTKSKKSSADSSWKYEDSNNEAKLKDSTLKSVQNKVNKYAQSTPWGNNDNIKFASSRVIDETNGRKTYEFSYGNGSALFTVYGYMDKNGNVVLNKDNNGKLAVEIFD